MSNERTEILDKFFKEEFPISVKNFYEEFSLKYTKRYQPLTEMTFEGGKKTLFKHAEDFICENYKIRYSIYKDFEFHSPSAFDISNGNFEPGQGNYWNRYLGLTGLSKIINEKVKQDANIECELVKMRLKSYIKRFFIQGGIEWDWIVADQICYHGVDKFPNSLDHEFGHLEYSLGFFEKWGHLPEVDGVPYVEMEGYKREKEFYDSLRKKPVSEYTYIDVLKEGRLNVEDLSENIIWAKCESLKEIPLIILYGPEQRREATTPYEFRYRFKINPDEIISDSSLLHEYLETYNEPENEIRKSFGLPKINEGWISETNLFYEIKVYFNKELVVHHGRPVWLGKQHLDIFLPRFNIGIEFQGDQHYYPVEFFGGEESFFKNQKRDEIKKRLCRENNCHLIYVNPNYKINDVL